VNKSGFVLHTVDGERLAFVMTHFFWNFVTKSLHALSKKKLFTKLGEVEAKLHSFLTL
jgi:hypothetical protein